MKLKLASGDTITAVLAAVKTSLDPSVVVQSETQFGINGALVALNGVTAVTLFTGDGFTTFCGLSLLNRDTGAITITITAVIGGTSHVLAKATLAVNDLLVIDETDIRVTNINGQVKTANAATVDTVLGGPFTGLIGASTAAAGSAHTDAGALPAGTGNVYPTTAADDTTGVKVNVADQVTGRTLFIGNGVSNKILKVYGPTGAVINGAAANAAFSSVSGKGVIMICLSGAGNTWLCF